MIQCRIVWSWRSLFIIIASMMVRLFWWLSTLPATPAVANSNPARSIFLFLCTCLLQVAFDGSRSICHACWHRINEALRRDLLVPSDPQNEFPVPGFTRVANTSRRCMVDDCNNGQLRAVPNSIKVFLLSYYQLHIPQLCRNTSICKNDKK